MEQDLMNDSMLQSIKNKECVGCNDQVRSDRYYLFCTARCAINYGRTQREFIEIDLNALREHNKVNNSTKREKE